MSQKNSSLFKIAFFIGLSFFAFSAYSQKISIFRGIVRDATTKEPIPFAAIFLANTSFGTSATESGSFSIDKIPDGKYDVIVSSVGYVKITYAIQFPSAENSFAFELQPDVKQLKTVVIEANEKARKAYYRLFVKFFLGETQNAQHCSIENPDDIYFDYDASHKILTAQADKSLIVINHALGYKIHYLLEEFKYDENKQTLRVFGIPRFEELQPETESQMRKWTRARDEAYFGSLNHFMFSLLHRSLEANKFRITAMSEDRPLLESNFFADSLTNKFEFKGQLRVRYFGENEEYNYRNNAKLPKPEQYSVLQFLEPSLTIYQNGYFENYKSLELEGYLAWSTVVSEIVPLEFEPHRKRK